MKRYAFLDVETTGLDTQRHEIIEVAFVLTKGPPLFPITQILQTKFQPYGHVSMEAAEVTGFPNGWESARPDDGLFWRQTLPKLEDVVPVGHNVSFDRGFLERAWRQHGVEAPFDYHWLDTMVLMPFLGFERFRLSQVIEDRGVHNAVQDALTVRKVMLKAYEELGF